MMDRRGLLAVAHIAKAQLAIDDDDWRDLVERETGQRSCAAADDRALVKLMRRLEAMGFENERKVQRGFKKAKKPQARLVWALWRELEQLGALRNPSRDACRSFCAETAKIGTASDPDLMTAEQLDPVIGALKAWVARAKRAKGESAA